VFSKRRVQFAILSTMAVLPLLLIGIGAVEAAGRAAAAPAAEAFGGSATQQSCDPISPFDPNNFSNPTGTNNMWLPLVPGTQYILEGTAEGEPHRVVFTVTDLTKVVNGVRTVVVWDRDFAAGQLVEAEIAFHAQDNQGNVWNLGEYPEEYEQGEFLGAPSTWIAGVAGAEAGTLMPANPQVGTPEYLQGRAPDIEFLDCGQVSRMGERTCVPSNCYENVLVITERSPLEPDSGQQLKYHAPGVGVVQVGAEGDPEGETLALVEVVQPSPQVLAEARNEALKLEERAYQVSDVYRSTPPIG
jgi:hypothetical protein